MGITRATAMSLGLGRAVRHESFRILSFVSPNAFEHPSRGAYLYSPKPVNVYQAGNVSRR